MNQKGVTLIEFLVVTLVISILLGTIFAGYRGRNKELVLQRVASKLTADIERTREMAMSAQGVSAGGYGIHFRNNWSGQYVIFADENSNQARSANEDMSTIIIENDIVIELSSNKLDIVFVPPVPDVYIDGAEGNARIRVSIDGNPSKFKEIIVNSAGLVYVE